MAVPECPECRHRAPRRLDAASEGARVNYYRCDECGHVWNVPKDDPDAVPTVVAQGQPKAARVEL